MKSILLLDDKKYGLAHIEASLKILKNVETSLVYCPSFKKYKALDYPYYNIIFLDYYLDIDGFQSTKIVEQLNCAILIAYSSETNCSQKIKVKAINSGKWTEEQCFVLTKTSYGERNIELEGVMARVLTY